MYPRRTFLVIAGAVTAGCLGDVGGGSDRREPVLLYYHVETVPADASAVEPASIENDRIRAVALRACEEQEDGGNEVNTRRVDRLVEDFEALPSYDDAEDDLPSGVFIECEEGPVLLELVYLA
jgi:hypothetical protein